MPENARYVTHSQKARSEKTDSTTEPPLRLYALCPCQVCQNTGRDAVGDRCSQCRGEGKVRVRVACADTPAELGVKLVEHARNGAWADGCQFGLLDAGAEEGSGLRWLILPWQASPTARNAADAARVLAGKRWK